VKEYVVGLVVLKVPPFCSYVAREIFASCVNEPPSIESFPDVKTLRTLKLPSVCLTRLETVMLFVDVAS